MNENNPVKVKLRKLSDKEIALLVSECDVFERTCVVDFNSPLRDFAAQVYDTEPQKTSAMQLTILSVPIYREWITRLENKLDHYGWVCNYE